MKITCQSCQAKYTIADEKVVGKVVKIRCKKCGATIVVNGSDPSAVTTEVGPPSLARATDAAGADPFTVNIAEGDQRKMSESEVAAAFRSGVIDVETFCWREGMNDWLPLRDIPELFAAVGGSPAIGRGNPGDRAAESVNGSLLGQGPAARRAAGRAPAADLFGGVAQAGSEEEVMTSAPSKMPPAHVNHKLIGARNENSVLFSLTAVTSKGDSDRPPPAASSGSEASGLIDIRQLSSQMAAAPDPKRSRVDDIMNLSGGGAFAPNLAAPALAAPPLDGFGVSDHSVAPGARNRGLILVAIGAGALLVAGAVGAANMMMGEKAPSAAGETPSASALRDAPSRAAVSATGKAEPPASAIVAAPEEATSAAAPVAAPAGPTKESEKPRERTPGSQTPAAQHEAAQRETSPPRAAAPIIEVDQPFNMGEAKARLAAAAGGASACKKPNGPTGTGRVIVLFSTSGAAQSASVTGDPFEGTATGTCVSGKFKAVRVPPFSGSPFSVSKSFTIN